jgi:glycosyltransferase involved in cell wall biosynthesis
MNKKSVCFVNTNRAWGGGEKWHFTTCQYLRGQDYDTFLMTNTGSELFKKAEKSGLPVVSSYITNLSFLNPFKILFFISIFKSHKVDTVIMNLPSDLKVAGIAAKLAGVKNIIYRRGMPHPLRKTWLNRFLFKKVLTHVIVNSQEIARSLSEANKKWFPTSKIVLVYNGVDTSIPLIPKAPLYQRQENEVVLGNIGRLVDQKGQKYLLDLVHNLKEDGFKVKLLIAGEGELKDDLIQICREHDIQDEVKLLGHIDDINGFMSSIDIFVFSSKFEGSANTLIETLYFQKPIVAFDVSSNPEIIIHGETGLLAKPFDTEDLTEKVKALIQSKADQEKFVQNGVKLLKERFDSAHNLEILKRIIDKA